MSNWRRIFFNVKMFVWQDIHDPEPRRCEDEEQEETNPRVVHEEQGPVDTRILFLKWKSVVVVHLGLKRCLYILWRLCLPVDVSRSPARNSCLNKCSLLSRPPTHEQIYRQEDLTSVFLIAIFLMIVTLLKVPTLQRVGFQFSRLGQVDPILGLRKESRNLQKKLFIKG